MKFSLINWVIVCFLCFSAVAGRAQCRNDWQQYVAQWTERETLQHASIGLFVADAETGEVMAESSSQLSLVPASTLKLLTTAAALELLGADYRFETRFAYRGAIQNDTLFGDLLILGGGDPALGSHYFPERYGKDGFLDQWVQKLNDLPVRYVTGNLIADVSVYDDQLIPRTWIWEDLGNYYGVGACGLSVYDNLYRIHLASPELAGEPTRVLRIEPAVPGLELENRVLSANDRRDRAYVFGSPLNGTRVLRGTIPKGKADFEVKASVPNPPLLLGWQLKHRLEQSGIGLAGEVLVKWQPGPGEETQAGGPACTEIAVTQSPTLAEIVDVTNHESVNLFAEHLLKHLAWATTGKGTTEEGIRVLTSFWEEKGIDTKGLFMADGSGLSRFNAITARQMVEVLQYMYADRVNGRFFFRSLPTVPNGTLWYFHPENFPNQALRAKSGSMTRVRCFAGLVETASGRKCLFAVFLNNFSCSQAQAIRDIEDLLAKLAEQ